VAEFLLAHGANPNLRRSLGLTPLHDAAMRVTDQQQDNHIRAEKSQGQLFVRGNPDDIPGHETVAKMLLEHGADVDAQSSAGDTPLLLAAGNGLDGVVKVLLDHNANIAARGEGDETALHRAASFGRAEVVRLLLAHKAEVNAQDKFLSTPLYRAALGRYGTPEGNPPDADYTATAELLIKNGADLKKTASHQATALHIACMSGEIGVAKLLLANHADVNAKDSYFQTPLHMAGNAGHVDLVELLLASHADTNARDSAGMTAVESAAARDKTEIVAILNTWIDKAAKH
jgi:ankyrin repeat protein